MPTDLPIAGRRPYYHAHGVTLYQADCRDVLAELADASIDFVFTDPPYGADQNTGDLNAALGKRAGKKRRAIANDSSDAADSLVRHLFAASRRLLKPGHCLACCCHGSGGKDLKYAKWSVWLEAVLDFKAAIVWDKGPMGLGWHYRRSYELVLVAKKPGAACQWHDTTKRVENVIRPGQYGIRKVPGRVRKHPTQKPPELAAHFLRLHTQPGGLVLDPFAGGGATLAAAVATGRRAIGVELER
ncbi:MAG: DNA methyltransferase, partial [Planctomycetota bacterium]